jgi:addiction module HigA family antidote
MASTSGTRTSTEPASLPRDPAVLGPLVHPGEMLLEEFLRPFGTQQSVVADELGISRDRLNKLVLRKRTVTADTAIRLERRFNMSARFWLHLQADHDLQKALNEADGAGRRTKRPG